MRQGDTGRQAGRTRRSVLQAVIAAMTFPFVHAWPERKELPWRSRKVVHNRPPRDRRSGSREVRIDPLFDAPLPARATGASVTFEPGARTAWHTHPLGQTLIVTSGAGRVPRWGGPVEEIRPGDVVWIPPGEKHWHGAAATTAMTHTAIHEKLDGKAVDWLEHVTADQYEGRSSRGRGC